MPVYGWKLLDVADLAEAKAYGEGHAIPDAPTRFSLVLGDAARLIVIPEQEQHVETSSGNLRRPVGERILVEVTGIATVSGRPRYAGVFHGRTFYVKELKQGTAITFGPEHVADVIRSSRGFFT